MGGTSLHSQVTGTTKRVPSHYFRARPTLEQRSELGRDRPVVTAAQRPRRDALSPARIGTGSAAVLLTAHLRVSPGPPVSGPADGRDPAQPTDHPLLWQRYQLGPPRRRTFLIDLAGGAS
jgi:hypothetical protein